MGTSEMGIGIQSDLPKTFKGDRGGLAEDADLLAELRAISSTSSKNRFNNNKNNIKINNHSSSVNDHDAHETFSKAIKKEERKENVPFTPVTDKGVGLQSVLPKTFKGDRGGLAEDADLLAELRAISSKSTGDRFGSKEKVGETNYGKESESGYIDSSDEYKELLRSHSKSSDDTAFIHSKDNDKPI